MCTKPSYAYLWRSSIFYNHTFRGMDVQDILFFKAMLSWLPTVAPGIKVEMQTAALPKGGRISMRNIKYNKYSEASIRPIGRQ